MTSPERLTWQDRELDVLAETYRRRAEGALSSGRRVQAKLDLLHYYAISLFKRAQSFGLMHSPPAPTHVHTELEDLWRYDGPVYYYRGDDAQGSSVAIRPELHLFVHMETGRTYIISKEGALNTFRPLNASQA